VIVATVPATALTGETPPGSLAQIAPVKYWSSEDYTRIVIQTTSPVQFNSTLLEKSGDQPRRLYIDFAGSYIPPQARDSVPIQDGLLKQARSSQISSDTVRVILDIESLSDYKVFSLNDPFRVIVDVHGIRNATVEPDRKPDTEQKLPTVVTPAPQVAKAPNVRAVPTDGKESPSLITLDDQKKAETVANR
jgi:N-acetylmuramoyl-L-alanine amidase